MRGRTRIAGGKVGRSDATPIKFFSSDDKNVSITRKTFDGSGITPSYFPSLTHFIALTHWITYLESIDSLTRIFSIVCEEKAHHDSSRKRAWVSLHLGLPSTVTLPLCRRRWGRRHAAASSCCRRSLFMSALDACMWCGGGGGGTTLPFLAQPCTIMPRRKM